MASGERKALSEVRVGDKLLVYSDEAKSIVFSDIVVVPHASKTWKVEFVLLVTSAGDRLRLTPDHLIVAGDCGTLANSSSHKSGVPTLPLISANKVFPGLCVLTLSGVQSVQSVSRVVSEGAYTALPQDAGLLVVNNIVVSPHAKNHLVAAWFYSTHCLVYSIAPQWLNSLFFESLNSCAS